jgi:hypothetical protein
MYGNGIKRTLTILEKKKEIVLGPSAAKKMLPNR